MDDGGKPFRAPVVRAGLAGEFAVPCTLVNVHGVTRVFSDAELARVAAKLDNL